MRSIVLILVVVTLMPLATHAKGEDGASQLLGGVQEGVSSVFQVLERFRLMVYEGAVAKIGVVEEERRREEERLKAEVKDDVNVDALITAQARPHVENVGDSSGIAEGLMMQALSIVTFIFGKVFIFYVLGIGILVWLVRFVWRRIRSVA